MQRRSGTVTAPVELKGRTEDHLATPGLLAVFADQRPVCVTVAPGNVGRDMLLGFGLEDSQMSRDHFELSLAGASLAIRDLRSRNGTFVNGRPLAAEAKVELPPGAVVRAGSTLFLAVSGLQAFERAPTKIDEGVVVGPRMATLFMRARGIGKATDQLFITGESGVGKELVATAFHRAEGVSSAPFIAVNCATIPAGLAERLLFGARRGSYTGADSDAEGYVQAASGGTLFLDEIAELDRLVQAKLLRFMETREYFPLGDVKPKRAELRLCLATLKDLGREVAEGRFRDDLRHRLATPAIALPPLRERKDEIPFFVSLSLKGSTVSNSIGFMEKALVSDWPGNVRQLLRCVDAAVLIAEIESRHALVPADLPEMEASSIDVAETEETHAPSDDEIRAALESSGGNVSIAARSLRISRSKLRRWMEKQPRI